MNYFCIYRFPFKIQTVNPVLLTTYVNSKNTYGESPLILSSKAGHLDIVNTLIRARAYLNQEDKRGMSSLAHSCNACHIEVVKTLIQAKAHVNKRIKERFLGKYKEFANSTSPLILGTKKGHLNVVNTLLQANAKVNLVISSYVSPTIPTRKVSYFANN